MFFFKKNLNMDHAWTFSKCRTGVMYDSIYYTLVPTYRFLSSKANKIRSLCFAGASSLIKLLRTRLIASRPTNTGIKRPDQICRSAVFFFLLQKGKTMRKRAKQMVNNLTESISQNQTTILGNEFAWSVESEWLDHWMDARSQTRHNDEVPLC